MTPERWKQIDELAQAALERGAGVRASFLDEACGGNESLRREVESQIAYQQEASKFLEEPAFKHAAELIADPQTETESMEGRTIGHYRILRTLGAGGMGEVYLAEDARLKRKVALKLLPAEFTQDHDRVRRFEQEAQAASALNHPNIITIHEIGEVAGAPYIVTEYVAGETLRARMKGEQQRLESALEIVLQVASALAVAHEAGIIHRDIKPENVMVRDDGLVKVLDFGLAKLTGPADDGVYTEVPTAVQQGTASGVVLGTVAYMSPEQARGLKVDARTDIFSLGVMLYEMIAGHQPFEGATTSDVIAAVLRTEPQPLARYSREVPETLEWIVSKALAKERKERHQTVKDLALDLRGLKLRLELEKGLERAGQPSIKGAAAAGSGQSASDETGRDEAAHAGEGISEPLTSSTRMVIAENKRHKLGMSLTLAAIAIAAVAAFIYFSRKPVLTDKDTILLADFVNTTDDAVLGGTLKTALAVQLEQSPFLNLFSDERVRETLRYMERSPDERVTKEIAREICQRQGLKALLAGTVSNLGSHYVISLEALNAQSGDVLARQQEEAESQEQVLRTLGQAATKLREKLGESLSSIQKFDAPIDQATTTSLEAFKAFSLASEANLKGHYEESIKHVNRAIELDPNFVLAYHLQGGNYFFVRPRELAIKFATKAFELRDRVSELERLRISSGYYISITGELDKAIETLEYMTRTYPRWANAHNNLGNQYAIAGQYEKATDEYLEAITLNPNLTVTYNNLANAFIALNRLAEAREILNQALARKLEIPQYHYVLYTIAFINGDGAEMKQEMDWASARLGEFTHLYSQSATAAFAGQGRQARVLSSWVLAALEGRNLKDSAAETAIAQSLTDAVFGNCERLKEVTAKRIPLVQTVSPFWNAAIALVVCGEVSRAEALVDESAKRFPTNTLGKAIWLPTIRAMIELRSKNPEQAIDLFEGTKQYEIAAKFWPPYVRGQAYLKLRKGAEAAAEFQKIIDHRGWDPLSYLYPLAHLGLARAALLTGDVAGSRKAYQDFFVLWKDADEDLSILIEAKKEYAGLKQ